MAEHEFVIDFIEPTNPELAELVAVREVARYWKAEEQFVRRRLREDGVHLVKVDYPLMVRLRDVQEFERAHTIILGSRADPKLTKAKEPAAIEGLKKEAMSTS
jgi:hypothetical protein